MNAMVVKIKRKGGRKRASPPVSIMPTSWDEGANGKANRAGLLQESATDIDKDTGKESRNPNGVKRYRRQTWVTIYAMGSQPCLSQPQAAAADRLYRASLGMQERDPLASLGEVRGPPGDPAVTRIDARREFSQMWARIPASSRPVVERVVLDDQPLWQGNTAQRERHIKRLQAGLDAIS